MANKTVLRAIKIKQFQQIAASGAHCYRLKETPNATKDVVNIVFKKPDDNNLSSYIKNMIEASGAKVKKAKQSVVETKTKNGKVKTRVQDNSSVLCLEFVAGASPAYLEKMNRKTLKKFGDDVVDFFNSEFGEHNVASAVMHLDEQSPHLHVHVVPLTEDGRLTAKQWLGGIQKCRELQQRYEDHMNERGHNLTRTAGSKAKHQDIAEFYNVINKSKEKQNAFSPFANIINANKLADENNKMIHFKNFLFERYPNKNKKLNKQLEKAKADLDALKKELSNSEKLNEKSKEEYLYKINVLEKSNKYLTNKNSELKKENSLLFNSIRKNDPSLYKELKNNNNDNGYTVK